MYETIRFYRQIETPCIVATPAAAAFDAATLAWVAAVVANGGTVSAGRKTLVDNLITGLKADGVWTKLDRLWLFAAENAASALTDLVADSLATAVNTPTLTVNMGYAGDGATSYIDTDYNPTTNGTNYLLNSAHFSTWELTDHSVATNTTELSADSGKCRLDVNQPIGTLCRMNTSSNDLSTITYTPPGHLLANRSTNTLGQFYQNGASVPYTAGGTTSLASANFFVDADNNAGTPGRFSTSQIAMASMGGNLSSTDASNFYNRLRTYMTAVGVPDAATAAWVAAVVANGGTVSAGRKTLVDNLITGLKADGVWTKLDRLWLFAGENQPSALTDLVADTLSTAVNSPTFTTDRGFSSNGTTSYVDTNYNAFTQGVNYTLNSAHLSVWDVTSGGIAQRLIGVTTTPSTHIYPNFSGSLYTRINESSNVGFAVADTQGFSLGNRSAVNATQTYKNGSSLGSDTVVSVTVQNSNGTLGYDAIAGGTYDTDQFAAATYGGSLSATDVSNLYNRLRTYMTAVGVP